MLKSTAGGGGIGMRCCDDAAELAAAFEAVERLARANFSDAGRVPREAASRARATSRCRSSATAQGEVLALGERDCSLQRRNQKVIEETPAPGLPPGLRRRARRRGGARWGAAARYRSAGTVEFVLDADAGSFYFLEVNTRLQVEHGVTEEVTGVDLVEWMVRLAAGELPPLDDAGAPSRGRRHRGAPLRRGPARGISSRAPAC